MDPLDKLKEVYDSLPKLECKKLCSAYCGPIPWSEIEDRNIMGKTGGMRLQITVAGSCPYLHKGLCAIYEHRPLICRLWGLVDDVRMRCPHGCKPERWLSNAEARILQRQVEQIQPTRFFGENQKPKEE